MATLTFFVRCALAVGCGLVVALVSGIILVGALRRYLFGLSFTWGEELPVYLAIYGVMFGVALSYMQDRHMRFTIVTDFLSGKSREILFAVMDVATMICGLLLAWSGWLFATRQPIMEASGIISSARSRAESTGQAWLVWLAHLGTWVPGRCARSSLPPGGGPGASDPDPCSRDGHVPGAPFGVLSQ